MLVVGNHDVVEIGVIDVDDHEFLAYLDRGVAERWQIDRAQNERHPTGRFLGLAPLVRRRSWPPPVAFPGLPRRRSPPRCVRSFRDRSRWVLRCDIYRYFPAIDHDIQKADLRRRIAFKRTLALLDRIIDRSNP